jgi:adenylyltransferase/sulfurtransferase
MSRPPLPALSAAEERRYRRHLMLPDVGAEGQRRLKAARVLLVGAGGLGSPLALYLAAAGIGTLGVADADRVDESNLQRQVLYGGSAVGRPKPAAARDRLRDLNPHVRVETHETFIDAGNAPALVAGFEVVCDGTDSLAARHVLNDACVRAGRPLVHGSVRRFEGRVSVFAWRDGPCYRCLHGAEPGDAGAEEGLLGVVPGVIGAIQAAEAVKLLLGVGEPLVGRLLIFDALAMRFRELRVGRDPDCPVCGGRAAPSAGA